MLYAAPGAAEPEGGRFQARQILEGGIHLVEAHSALSDGELSLILQLAVGDR